MSIKLMSLVFDTTFQPTPKIVLMALADRADDNGGSLWPGIKEVARKSSLSERQTQRVLHWLEGLGLVPVVGNQYGGKPGETVQRRINVQLLRSYANGSPAPRMSDPTGDKTAPVTGDIGSAGRVTSETETGDMGVTQYTSDPSVNTSTPHTPQGGTDGSAEAPKKARGSAVGLKAWLDAIKTTGEKPVPADDTVFAWAEEVGLPREFLGLAWAEFKSRYCQPDAKRYTDWRSVFRKAVRGNWMRLWYLDGDTYVLTTQGQQARKIHKEVA